MIIKQSFFMLRREMPWDYFLLRNEEGDSDLRNKIRRVGSTLTSKKCFGFFPVSFINAKSVR